MSNLKRKTLRESPLGQEWLNKVADLLPRLDRAEALEMAIDFARAARLIRQQLANCPQNSDSDAQIELTYQAHAPQPEKTPAIPKGFVLVNLSESEKRELRDLARESGQALRDVLRHALFDVRGRLKNWVKIQRITGLNPMQQEAFLGFGSRKN